jgi:hypothetical protein
MFAAVFATAPSTYSRKSGSDASDDESMKTADNIYLFPERDDGPPLPRRGGNLLLLKRRRLG